MLRFGAVCMLLGFFCLQRLADARKCNVAIAMEALEQMNLPEKNKAATLWTNDREKLLFDLLAMRIITVERSRTKGSKQSKEDESLERGEKASERLAILLHSYPNQMRVRFFLEEYYAGRIDEARIAKFEEAIEFVIKALPKQPTEDGFDEARALLKAAIEEVNFENVNQSLRAILDREGGYLSRFESIDQWLRFVRWLIKIPLNGTQLNIYTELSILDAHIANGRYYEARSQMVDFRFNGANFAENAALKDVQTVYRNVRAGLAIIRSAELKVNYLKKFLETNKEKLSRVQIMRLEGLLNDQRSIISYYNFLFADSFIQYVVIDNHLERIENDTQCSDTKCRDLAKKLRAELGTEDFLFVSSGWNDPSTFISLVNDITRTTAGIELPNQPLVVENYKEVTSAQKAIEYGQQKDIRLAIEQNILADQKAYAWRVFNSEPIISKTLYTLLTITPFGKYLRDSPAMRGVFIRFINARALMRHFYPLTKLLRENLTDEQLAAAIRMNIHDLPFLETFMRRSDFVGRSDKLLDFCTKPENALEWGALGEELKKAIEARKTYGYIEPDYRVSPLDMATDIYEIGLRAVAFYLAGSTVKNAVTGDDDLKKRLEKIKEMIPDRFFPKLEEGVAK
jgi:hypothetical protein